MKPWRSHSWRRFPFATTLLIVGATAAVGLAFLVLALSDGQPIDSWAVSPTIILSIIATLANAMLRSAFRSGADLFWWTQLLSESGVTLKELHGIWGLGHDWAALLSGSQPFPAMRSAGVLIVLLAVNGPLFQKAITVDLAVRPSRRTATLPIRVEPMWNQTVLNENGHNGWAWSFPPYQPEFAELSADLSQRQSPQLSSVICAKNSTCTTQVVIAGFSRDCVSEETAVRGVKSIGDANFVVLSAVETDGSTSVKKCFSTGSEASLNSTRGETNDSYCRFLETYYQLALSASYPQISQKGEPQATSINYTSYLRLDGRQDTLTVRRCTFTPSFIRVPIQIANGSSVTLLQGTNTTAGQERNVIEKVLSPFPQTENIFLLGGFVQVMKDLFQGYILFDTQEASPAIRGTGPRQYINSTSISRKVEGKISGFTYDILDPLDDFSKTLDEVCLRYALKSIPTNREPNSGFVDPGGVFQSEALAAIKTPLSKDQTVELSESTVVAVYKVRYVFTLAALGVTLAASLSVSFLLAGWRRLGRDFSVSPLEVAKAFDAPLLRDVGSNVSAEEMAKELRAAPRVRYGEVWEGGPGKQGEEDGGVPRLMVDETGRVSAPRRGELYG